MRFYRFQPGRELLRSLKKTAIPFRGDVYSKKLDELRASKIKEKKKVVIIGAGITGLTAGLELKKLGMEVSILEAQADHIGGRLRTFRKDGLHIEFGAMRIPKSHTLTRRYIAECSLTLRPFVQDNHDTFCYVRNKVFKRSDQGIEASKLLFDLPAGEKDKNLTDLWTMAVLSIIDGMSDAEKEDLFKIQPEMDKVLQLDRSSLYEAFKKAGLSEEATEYVLTHFGLETYVQTSLAEHIREEIEQIWNPEDFAEIAEGTDSLANRIYEQLKEETIRPAKVFRIEQEKDGATVYYRDVAGNEVKVMADWVICTVPLGILSKMDIAHAFSDQKIRAIRRVNYDSSTKVVVKTRNRFWELKDKIFGGGTIYDGPAGHTWYPSDNSVLRDPKISESPSYLLASYTWGQTARRVDSIPEAELKAFILGELRKVHPYLQDEDILEVMRWSWTDFEWSSGAFAFFNPGEHQFLHRDLTAPEGRILLAGEHCSLTHSWIQGSLESSIDTCTYIVNSL